MHSTNQPAGGVGGHYLSLFTGALNDNLFKQAFMVAITLEVASDAASMQWKNLLTAALVIPFILCAPLAGRLTDTMPKHRLVRRIRIAEVGICLFGGMALISGLPWLMVLTLGLLGVQSALFAPAKFAIIPELVSNDRVEDANGMIGALTPVAILLGTGLAFTADPSLLDETALAAWDGPGLLLLTALVAAGIGIYGAFRIPSLQATCHHSDVRASFGEQWRALSSAPGLWQAALGLAGFWAVGAIALQALSGVAVNNFGLTEKYAAALALAPGLGTMVGALLAPRLSHQGFPGALPVLGACLTGLCLIGAGELALAQHPLAVAEGSLMSFSLLVFVAGIGIGFWTVPLNVILQQQSDPSLRGRVISGASVLSILTTCLALTISALCSFLGSAGLLVLFGLIAVTGALATAIPYRFHLVTWFGSTVLRFLYRFDIKGLDKLPQHGGCLVVCNHISYADGVALMAALPRPGRFLVFKKIVDKLVLGFPLRAAGVIPVDGGGSRKALVGAIDAAVAAAERGEVVVIFPEGKISRSGQMDRFQAGMERIAKRAKVPVIPAHLHGFYGSLWSRARRFRGPWLRRHISIRLGQPHPYDTSAQEARQMVQELSHKDALERSQQDDRDLGEAMLRMAKARPNQEVFRDGQGILTRKQLAVASLALVDRLGLATGEQRVGVVLPPGRAAAIINASLTLDARTAVNLNHTVGDKGLQEMAELAGLQTVITSKLYHRKIGAPELPGRQVFVEDLLGQLGGLAKFIALLKWRLLPPNWLSTAAPDDVAAVVFSSGSTSTPKGVQLTHRQILANLQGVSEQLNLGEEEETILSPLPVFHSFGLTIGTWLPMAKHVAMLSHPDPTDGKGIGKLAADGKATVLISTPTFVRGYLRRVDEEQFASLKYAIVGAEKCPVDLKQTFTDKYKAPLLEGYGATELGPAATFETIDTTRDGVKEKGSKPGSVGRPLPGIDVVTIDPDSGELLPPGKEGLLVVRSPARMLGYLDQPELTAKAFVHEGYNTGDIGHVDKDGFVFLSGRLARFAKIGGEMVPLDKVQEALQLVLSEAHPDSDAKLAVAAAPDKSRGEKLVVLHTELPCPVQELIDGLQDLPPLFTPKGRDCHQVEALPVLGTGKLDLKGLSAMAHELAG